MAYLNLDLDYFDHPKTRRLVAMLGRGSEVFPIKLWAYFGKFSEKDGEFKGSSIELEGLIQELGHDGKLVKALIKAGFLEKVSRGFRAKDWKKHQGHLHGLKVRNRNAAISRWAKMQENTTESPVPVAYQKVPVAYQKPDPGMPHTLPNHTVSKVIKDKTDLEVDPSDLESIIMPFGEWCGSRVSEVPAKTCSWLLNGWKGKKALDPQLKLALRARVNRYNDEVRRKNEHDS